MGQGKGVWKDETGTITAMARSSRPNYPYDTPSVDRKPVRIGNFARERTGGGPNRYLSGELVRGERILFSRLRSRVSMRSSRSRILSSFCSMPEEAAFSRDVAPALVLARRRARHSSMGLGSTVFRRVSNSFFNVFTLSSCLP